MARENQSPAHVPVWLKNIQLNSWEPEILLSGLVLFGLLQLPQKIKAASNFLNAELLGNNLAGVFTASQIAVYTLVCGLIVHLFLRSVWVGLIGLSFTFPNGIQAERLNFREAFRRRVEALPTFQKQIISLEKVCSSIFATCFFLIMMIAGLFFGILLVLGLVYLVDTLQLPITGISFFAWADNYVDSIISLFILLVMVDFIGIGLLRKNRIIGRIYYPIHLFVSWVTLARIYSPIYYLFATNVKRRYVSAFLVVFIFVILLSQSFLFGSYERSLWSRIVFYSAASEVENQLFSPYFADRNDRWQSQVMEIPSPIVSGRFLEVRLKHQITEEARMLEVCGITMETAKSDGNARIACVNKYYRVLVDGTMLDSVDWLYFFFQDSGRKGFISMVDTYQLSSGKHSVEIRTYGPRARTVAKTVFYKE